MTLSISRFAARKPIVSVQARTNPSTPLGMSCREAESSRNHVETPTYTPCRLQSGRNSAKASRGRTHTDASLPQSAGFQSFFA